MNIKKHCWNCSVEKYKIEYCQNCFNKYITKEQLEKFINDNFLYAYKCVLYYSAWLKKDNLVHKLLDINFIDFQQEQQLRLFEL